MIPGGTRNVSVAPVYPKVAVTVAGSAIAVVGMVAMSALIVTKAANAAIRRVLADRMAYSSFFGLMHVPSATARAV